MGLRERRAIDLVKNRDIPEAQREIQTYLGTSFPLNVDWSTIEDAGEDAVFSVNGMALKKISGAMLTASHDEFVKKEFAKAIKGVEISHVPNNSDKNLVVADGIIHLKVNFNDIYDGAFSDSEIYDALMDAL